MNHQTLHLTRKEAAPFIKATFPEYNGRKIKVKFSEKITFYDTNWGGGTRNQYAALKMDGTLSRIITVPAPWINPIEGETAEIPAGILVVEHSIFCGHDLGITIHARPETAPKWLNS